MPRHRSFSRRCANRLSSIHGFAPSLELLEVRLTPAIMGLDFQLLTDNNGVPGTALTRLDDLTHNINVNQTFWVQILAWDERGATVQNPGVISLPLNLAWDSSVVTLQTTLPAVPIALGNSILTSSFPLQRSIDTLTASTITGLRAGALPNAGAGNGAAIGTQIPVDSIGVPNTSTNAQFSLLKFQARSTPTTSDSPFKLTLAGSMSFTDAASLDDIDHVTPTGRQLATNEVDVIEFLKITQITEPTATTLSGFVYTDVNNNGKLDRDTATGAPTEFGLPNVTVTLNGGAAPLVTTTGPDGAYHFENLSPGTFNIVETQPAHFVDGVNTLGLVIPAGGGTPVARGTVGVNQFTGILINSGDNGVDYDFGENMIPTKLNFLTSAKTRTLIAMNLGVEAETFTGAAGAADITVTAGASDITVTQGGTTKTFSQPLVTIDANGANVTIVGTSADEVADIGRGYGSLRFGADYLGAHYAVLAINAKEVTVDPGAGTDLAILEDSPATDALTATGATLELRSAADVKAGRAIGFETVRAISPSAVRTTNTDTDTVTQAAKALIDQLIGDWTTI